MEEVNKDYEKMVWLLSLVIENTTKLLHKAEGSDQMIVSKALHNLTQAQIDLSSVN